MYCRLANGAAAYMCGTVVCGTLLLTGCAGLPQLGSPVASYAPTTIFSPEGYGQTKVDDTHYRVEATGTESTPKERVEKMARARAAQIAVETKQKYYKVTSVEHSVACKKRRDAYKGESTAPSSRPTVVVDVVYADTQADPEFADANESFVQMKADLASENVTPEARNAAKQATLATCGEGTGA
jgi:hypothetical protein